MSQRCSDSKSDLDGEIMSTVSSNKRAIGVVCLVPVGTVMADGRLQVFFGCWSAVDFGIFSSGVCSRRGKAGASER
jgi:hypothetical protein